MTDIVDRLQSGEPCGVDPFRMKEARSGCLCAEAADEIETQRHNARRAEADLYMANAAIGAVRDACGQYGNIAFVDDAVKAAITAAYMGGQEDMRERAVMSANNQRQKWQAGYGQKQGAIYAEAIIAELRALPIKEMGDA